MSEIQVFSDQSCTNEIDAVYVYESGHNSGYGDGSNAFDSSTSTEWRPQCHPCTSNQAWVTFTTSTKAKCVTADNLGSGSAGGENWNGGILVELLYSETHKWYTAMESTDGNTAVEGIRAILIL